MRNPTDRRRLQTGPERLLAKLVKRGLPEGSLRAAAALVMELDRMCLEDATSTWDFEMLDEAATSPPASAVP